MAHNLCHMRKHLSSTTTLTTTIALIFAVRPSPSTSNSRQPRDLIGPRLVYLRCSWATPQIAHWMSSPLLVVYPHVGLFNGLQRIAGEIKTNNYEQFRAFDGPNVCFCSARGSQSPWRKPTQAQGQHTNSTQEGQSWYLNLKPSNCETHILTTWPLCYSC